MAVTPTARPGRPRRWLGVVAWTLWALAILGFAATVWLAHLLRQAGRPDLAHLVAVAAATITRTEQIGRRGRGRCRTAEESMMAVIQNTTLIDRGPEEVFDYLVDLRNELEWNPGVESMKKLTDDPLELVFPVLLLMMKRQEQANMTYVKQALERRSN